MLFPPYTYVILELFLIVAFIIPHSILFSFFKDFILFIFRERAREGEREGEKHQCVVASCVLPTGGLAHNPDMCPDWKSNQRPFGSHAGTQSTEPHQPGLPHSIFNETSQTNIFLFHPTLVAMLLFKV